MSVIEFMKYDIVEHQNLLGRTMTYLHTTLLVSYYFFG